ncbi:MAG: prepilin-type N-terminal cleavage/methylation domain-containing protein, partial [Planctomycetota bacterium]
MRSIQPRRPLFGAGGASVIFVSFSWRGPKDSKCEELGGHSQGSPPGRQRRPFRRATPRPRPRQFLGPPDEPDSEAESRNARTTKQLLTRAGDRARRLHVDSLRSQPAVQINQGDHMNNRTRQQNGFTILELMIVVAIIAIIASVALPSLANARKSANEGAAVGNMKALCAVME